MFRFAPSPTGDMHIGNLRVALFNYICAKQHNEKFIIRIEDTDRERNIEGKDQEILQMLNVFGIKYDEVYYQSHNLKFHQQIATKLLVDKLAFSCFCSEDLINKKREAAFAKKEPYRYDGTCEFLSDEEVLNNENPFVIRIKKPKSNIEFTDLIKGKMSFDPHSIDSFVLLRADKYPTYNFACSVDDMLHNIGFIIRGEDHISNTPKQILIRKYLGYDKEIKYAHLPIILNEEGKKMSKRQSASSVKWLLKEGFLSQAITNYLILLGNKTPSEIFDLESTFAWFDIKKLSKSPAKFDLSKLKQINREHIRKTNPKELAKLIGYSSDDIGELAKLYTEEASTLKEIKTKIDTIFAKKEVPSEFEDNFIKLRQITKEAPNLATFDEFKNFLMKQSKLKGKNFFKPLRFLLTGAEHGPNLSDIYPYIKNHIKELIS